MLLHTCAVHARMRVGWGGLGPGRGLWCKPAAASVPRRSTTRAEEPTGQGVLGCAISASGLVHLAACAAVYNGMGESVCDVPENSADCA